MVIFKIEVPGFQFFCKVVLTESSPQFSFQVYFFHGLFKLQKLTNIGPQLSQQQECFPYKSFFLALKVTAKQLATSNKVTQWFHNGRKDAFRKFYQRKNKLTVNYAGKQGISFIV